MVFARTSKAAARLSEAFARHAQDRRYLAVVQGALREARDLEDWLIKDGRTGMVRTAPPARRAQSWRKLRTQPLGERGGRTLVEATLFTGRAHQIRVQHAHAGYPLWGDARYGGGRPGEQIALWAAALAFDHPTRRERLRFIAPPPDTGAWRSFAPRSPAGRSAAAPKSPRTRTKRNHESRSG